MTGFIVVLVLIGAAPSRPWHPQDEPRPGSGRLLNYTKPRATALPTGSLGFSHSIPVPAFHGLEPAVQLAYRSDEKTRSEVGLGWTLEATSEIRARGADREVSGGAHPVYWLDGIELAPCIASSTGGSCRSGGTHELRDDRGLKIVKEGPKWRITQRNGTIDEYAQFTPSQWLLESRTDTSSNRVEWAYTISQTRPVVASISYGSEATIADRYRVLFHYLATTERPTVAHATGLGDSGLELRAIQTAAGATVRDTFVLEYNSGSGERGLAAIQQFGEGSWLDSLLVAHGEAAPPVVFSWPRSPAFGAQLAPGIGASLTSSAELANGGAGSGAAFPAPGQIGRVGVPLMTSLGYATGPLELFARTEWFSGEFDGDISSDFVGVWIDKTRINLTFVSSKGATVDVATPWVLPNQLDGDPAHLAHAFLVGNANGDGKTDLYFVVQPQGVPEKTQLWRALPQSWGHVVFESAPAAERIGRGLFVRDHGPFRAFSSDRNGDGLTDITVVQQYDPAALLTSNKNDDAQILVADFVASGHTYQQIESVPFGGVCPLRQNSHCSTDADCRDSSLTCDRAAHGCAPATTSACLQMPWSTSFLYLGDSDGDGDSDLSFLAPTSVAAARAEVFTSDWQQWLGLSFDTRLLSTPFPVTKEACASHFQGANAMLWVSYAQGTSPSGTFSAFSLQPYCATNNLFRAGTLGERDRLAGDFDGDGRLDLLLLVPASTPHPHLSSRLILSRGDSIQQRDGSDFPLELSSTYYPLSQWLAADVDGDGKSDVVSISPWDLGSNPPVVSDVNRVRVFRSEGDGTFSLLSETQTGVRPRSEFAFRGCTEHLSPNCTTNPCPVLCGGSKFQAISSDSDGDGRAEIAFAFDDGSGGTSIGQSQTSTLMPSLREVATGDVNGDGLQDTIRVRHSAGSVELMASTGSADSSFSSGRFTGNAVLTGDDGQAVVGDFGSFTGSADGLADVVVFSSMHRRYIFAYSAGDNWRTTNEKKVSSTLVGAPVLRAPDIDGDGDSDLVLAEVRPSGALHVVTIQSNGAGTIAEFDQDLALARPLADLMVANVHGGLRMGLVVVSRAPSDYVFETYGFRSSGWDRLGETVVPFDGAGSFQQADINADGVTDLVQVRTATSGPVLRILTGTGAGTFATETQAPTCPSCAAPAIPFGRKYRFIGTDVDEDGDTDFLGLPLADLSHAPMLIERTGNSWVRKDVYVASPSPNASGTLSTCAKLQSGCAAICYATIDSSVFQGQRVYAESRWLLNEPAKVLSGFSNGIGLTATFSYRTRQGHGDSSGLELLNESWVNAGSNPYGSDIWSTNYTWSGFAFDYARMRPFGAQFVTAQTTGANQAGVPQLKSERLEFGRGVCGGRLIGQTFFAAGATRETTFNSTWTNTRGASESAVQCVRSATWTKHSDFAPSLDLRRYQYDRFGNVIEEARFGRFLDANSDGTDDFLSDNYRISSLYGPAGSSYVVDRPHMTTLYVGAAPVEWSQYEYDGLASGMTIGRGMRTARLEWNNQTNLFERSETQYDAFGNVILETSAGGRQVSFTIDPAHHLFVDQTCRGAICEHTEWSHSNQLPNALISTAGMRTRLTYDAFGRIRKKQFPDFGCVEYAFLGAPGSQRARVDVCDGSTNEGGNNGLWTDYYLDGLGRTAEIRRTTGSSRTFSYWLDSDDLSSESVWGRVTPPSSAHSVYRRDSMGNILATEFPGGSTKQTHYSGNAVLDIDENGIHTLSELDGFGRVEFVTEAVGSAVEVKTTYARDHAGRVVATINSSGDRREVTYNSLGHNVLECDPSSGCSTREFLGDGTVVREQDASGRVINFFYDAAGRLTERSNLPKGYFQRWYYDVDPRTGLPSGQSNGFLVGIETSSGANEYLEIDSRGRNVSTEVCAGKCAHFSEVYSQSGLLTNVSTPGTLVTYEHDQDGEVRRVPSHGLVVEHHPSGNLSRVLFSSGAQQVWSEDPFRGWRTETRVTDRSNNVVFAEARTPGRHGETKLRNLVLAGSSRSEQIVYDDLYRVRRVEDPLTHVASEEFDFDLRGNPTSSTLGGQFGYSRGAPVHGVTSSGWGSYGYDASGRTVTTPNGSLVWDHGGDLARAGLATGATIDFVYSTDRRRILKVGGSSVEYQFSRYYVELNGKDITRVFVDDIPVLEGNANNWTSVHADLLGSASATLDPGGSLLGTRSFSTFGYSAAPAIAYGGFAGHPEDSETGLVRVGERYFDPVIGRFASPDPEVASSYPSQGLNRYSYGLNSPYDFRDPSGRAPVIVLIAVGVAIVATWKNCEERPLAPVVLPLAATYAPVTSMRVATIESAVANTHGSLSLYDAYQLQQSGRSSDDKFKDAQEAFKSALVSAVDAKILASEAKPAGPDVSNRPSSFRRATEVDAWASAADGPTGGKLCPTCGMEVKIPPGKGTREKPRDWDVDHQPPWSKRDHNGWTREEILDDYNRGTRLECPQCNRSRGATPAP